ncbi:SAM-dependent methyltransferase, partial [Bacteriovoracaceae bacterium]|nr:SAM-dependent methyltransferase [Bacteriovoracaceae bacterium]
MNKKIIDKFLRISELLQKHLPLLSQWDLDVISENRIEHKWINKLMGLTSEELTKFDASREFTLLDDLEWTSLVKEIEILATFRKISRNETNVKTLGNLKKQHELRQLYSFMESDHGDSIVDFGGGVGNLAYFLESELAMDVKVLEKDVALIEKGKTKLRKLSSNVNFEHCLVSATGIPNISNSNLAIGLHTCGNFAIDMFNVCVANNTKKIINFGCCYSKIKDDCYHLSSLSDNSLHFNQRVLSSATQAFNTVPISFYDYRDKIMNYKFTFYHWLYKVHGNLTFCSMSNARSSLYKNSFADYLRISLNKYFPELEVPSESSAQKFFKSTANLDLNHYLRAYYALS